MKPLSPLMQTAAGERGVDVVWLARIHGADATVGVASRRVDIAGVAWPPLLLAVRSIRLSARRWLGFAVRGEETAVVEIAQPESTHRLHAESLSAALASGAEGSEIGIGVVFLPKDSSATIGEVDPVWLFHGRIAGVSRDALIVRIEARGMLDTGAVAVPRSLRPDVLARLGMDTRAEVFPPLVFGRVAACPLSPWNLRLRARLVEPLEYAYSVMYVDSVEGWPPAGRAQVGDEVFEYQALDAAKAMLGSATSPLVRPERRGHRIGAPVWLLPEEGPAWLVAGHPCHAVADIRADGRPLPKSLGHEVATHSLISADAPDLPPTNLALLRCDRIPWVLDYATEPARIRLTSAQAALSIDPLTNAINPAAILDDDLSTAATVRAGATELRVACNLDLARQITPDTRIGDRALGRYESLVVEYTIGADRVWNEDSRVIFSIRWRQFLIGWFLPRPAAPDYVARVTAGAPGDPVLTGDTGVPPRVFSIDISGFIRVLGKWAVFSAPEEPLRFELQFRPVSDRTILRVYDFHLTLGYCPASRCEAVADLTAAVEGRVDAGGALIESPVAILRDLLTAPDMAAFPAADLVETDWVAAAAAMDARGARMRRRLSRPVALETLVDTAARESGLSLFREGRGWRLLPTRPNPGDGDVSEAADVGEGGIVRAGALERIPLGEILNDVEVFGPDPRTPSGHARLARVEAGWSILGNAGRRAGRAQTHWWPSDGTADAQAWRLAGDLVERGARRGERVEVEVPLTRLALERGDLVSLVSTALRAAHRLGEIESILIDGSGATMVLAIRLAPSVSVVWESGDAAARLQAADDGTELAFFIDGRKVASLTGDGALRVAGSVAMDTPVAAAVAPDGDALSWDAENRAIALAAGPAGARVALAVLDAVGNLSLAGSARERAIAPGDGTGGDELDPPAWLALEADGAVALSANRRDVVARLAPDGDLHLAKDLNERALPPP